MKGDEKVNSSNMIEACIQRNFLQWAQLKATHFDLEYFETFEYIGYIKSILLQEKSGKNGFIQRRAS